MSLERRYINASVETRAKDEGESRAIGGIAAMVNTPTVLFEDEWNGKREKFIEVIFPGAFDDVMNDDTRALVNHNSEKIIGRRSADTLTISITPEGHLEYNVPNVPETSYGNDLLISVRRKEITQSSFGFRVKESRHQREEDETEVRYIREIVKLAELADVSPVTFPAYESTITEMRSAMQKEVEEMRKEFAPKEDAHDDLAQYHEQIKTKLKILAH